MRTNGGFNRAHRYDRRQMSHFVASLPLDLVAKQMADELIEHAWWCLALTTGSHSWYDDHVSLLPLRTNYCPADFCPGVYV